MAGYDDTRNKILETLLQRPVGTEIQPENHQDFALSLLDYIRSVELISGSTLIGIAYQDTVPVQSNDANEAYIAGVAQERTVVFQNFRDVNGDPLTVTTEEMEAKLVVLIWNRQYWSKQEISANIVSQAENAYYFYNLTIRKQYASVAAMNADKVSPMGNDGRVIKRGEIVSVRNPSNSDEDAVYSYELDAEGNPSWVLQMKLSALATRTIDGGSASVKLDTIQNKRDTKANWETNNPVLAEGEIGLVLDDKNSYKVGDGVTKWNDLPLRGYNGNVVSEFGDDFNSVISQGGITNLLKYIVGNDNKIEIGTSNFDVLDNVKMAGFYVLTTNSFPAYHMLVTFDNMAHCFNQWIFGNLVLTNGTITDGAHTDGTFNIICRTYSLRTQNAGSDNVEITAGTWTKWRYLQSFFLRDKDGNIGHEEKTFGESAIENKITVLQNNIIELVDDLESDFNDKILDVEGDYDYLLLEYQKLIDWIGELNERLNDQKDEINVAKEEALQAIAENEQSAITNFNSQRVTPEMLSESTKQLIEASGGGTITNLADDEDLTSVDDGTGSNVLKFKDKAYNPLTYSGMGRKILRKNIVNSVNVLTQSMINTANVIYVIQYDYIIGENITIPANCVLKFEGGSINNSGDYTLTGQDTVVIAGVTKIIDANIKIDGTWKAGLAFPEWFGAKGDGESDDSLSFRKTFENFSNVVLHKKTYCMHMVPVKDLNLVGNGATLKYNGPILGQGGTNSNHELNILVSRAGTPPINPEKRQWRTTPQFDTFRVTGVNFFFDGQNKRIYPFPDYKTQLSRGVFIYGFRCAIVENCTFDDSVGCSLQFSAVERVEVRNCSFTNIGPRHDERLLGAYNAINIGQQGGYYNWDTGEDNADVFYYFCEDAIIENCRIEKVCDVGITYLARNFICRNCYFNKVGLPFEPVDINGDVKSLYMSQIKLIENCQFYYCGSIVIPSPGLNDKDDPTKNYSSVSIIRNNLIEHPNEWLEDGHTEYPDFSLFMIFSSGVAGGRIIDSTCIIENNIVKNAPNIKGNIVNILRGGRCVVRDNTFEATNSLHMAYADATDIVFIQNNYFDCLSGTGYMFSVKDSQLYVNNNNICTGTGPYFQDKGNNKTIMITDNKFSTSHEYGNLNFKKCDRIDVINNEFINTRTNIGNARFIMFEPVAFKFINIIGNKCEKLLNLDSKPSSVEKFIIRDNICSDFKNVGTATERRALKLERATYKALFKNFEFYDTDLNMGLVFNGDDFVSENGFTAARNRGTTAQRPVAMQNVGSASVTGQLKSNRDVGFEYFDTDLNKPIYATVIDNSTGSITWVDATGTTV